MWLESLLIDWCERQQCTRQPEARLPAEESRITSLMGYEKGTLSDRMLSEAEYMGSVLGFRQQAVVHSFDDPIFEYLTEIALLEMLSATQKGVQNTSSLFCYSLDRSPHPCAGSIRLSLRTLFG